MPVGPESVATQSMPMGLGVRGELALRASSLPRTSTIGKLMLQSFRSDSLRAANGYHLPLSGHDVWIGVQLVQHGNIGRACDLADHLHCCVSAGTSWRLRPQFPRVVLPKLAHAVSESCSHLVCALCKKSSRAVETCFAVHIRLKIFYCLRSNGLT
jgi:hypothetical protein